MEDQEKKAVYAEGLCFSCTRCSDCCRHEPGFVYLSGNDIQLLAEGLQMRYNDVIKSFCRWVPAPNGLKLSLKEKANFDCIFWQDGCTIYQSRPLQCRTFPFWESNLSSQEAWESLPCPGIGKGTRYGPEYIKNCLKRRMAEPVMVREA